MSEWAWLFYLKELFIYLFIVFLGPHLQHMEVPRLGVELELLLLAHAIAKATPDLSHICNLHHSSWQHQILNPLRETRDGTHILMKTSQGLNPLSHNGNLQSYTSFSPLPSFSLPIRKTKLSACWRLTLNPKSLSS